jgi:protein-tyrosine phosphatase
MPHSAKSVAAKPLIDLHCHILPGIDDGPQAMEDSVELARAFERDGIRTVAATPHLREDHPRVRADELEGRCRRLEQELRRVGLQLGIVPAGEVDIVWGLEAQEDELRQVSFAQRGTDLLVETPSGPLPSNFEDLLFRLTIRGYRILLAHPERNPTFQRDPRRLTALAERGALVQVMATSLAPGPGRARSTRMARSLVTEGLAHVLASDAHGPDIPGRMDLATGLQIARKLVGPHADWMVMDAPAAVLAGEPLPPRPSRRKSWWRGWLGSPR